jgi:hypothetical protein
MKNATSRRPSPVDARKRRAIAQALEALEARHNERAESLAAERARVAKLQRAMQAPFEKLISADPAAKRSLEALQRTGMKSRIKSGLGSPRSKGVMDVVLHEHLSIVVPVYDFDWQVGSPQEALHDRFNGQMGIIGKSGAVKGGADGHVTGAAGIGLVITTDKPVMVNVRPFIPYDWQSAIAAYGLFSSGTASGGFDAAAWLNGQLIAGVQRSQLFSKHVGVGSDDDDGGGVAWVPDLTLNFRMNAGDSVALTFGTWIDCDQSGGVGAAAAEGKIEANVKWVVVERWVAG